MTRSHVDPLISKTYPYYNFVPDYAPGKNHQHYKAKWSIWHIFGICGSDINPLLGRKALAEHWLFNYPGWSLGFQQREFVFLVLHCKI